MSIEQERLLSLVEFAQQSARLRTAPAANISQHRIFALPEHQLQGLPGVGLNGGNGNVGDDEIWLSIERRRETKPPDMKNAILRPWVEMTQGPSDEPVLKRATDGASLIMAGSHRSSLTTQVCEEEARKPAIDPRTIIVLEEYEHEASVRAQFKTYIESAWHPWAEVEKLNRRTIKLYSQLFTLKQQLEGVIVEAPLELVWGVGLSIWGCNGTLVSYPLITQLVELALNPETAAVEIRPRDVDARLEIDWHAAVGNPGVADLEKTAKEFFGKASSTFSPFDRSTYDGLLRSAVAFLDADGVYWPDEVPPQDRTLPRPEHNLKVTDTWVLFARPRTNSLFLQDLEKLKKAIESGDDQKKLPPAVAAVVTEPETESQPVELPRFRGVSATYHLEPGGNSSTPSAPARDLYFPKPFNDEQVRIIQLLEVSDGVTVQGPPGTGKTHTIANVICHYLAGGKRVLVTSMKDPALGVLQAQLPEEIRPLAISLLTSEQEGMKQFEHAIHKIASDVQVLDRRATASTIKDREETIDALHGRLVSIDRKVGDWAKRNLAKIVLGVDQIEPEDAAREVVANAGQFEWIPDALGAGPEFAPQFGDEDVIKLREARRLLGTDIDYLDATLPQLVEFPDTCVLLQVHQDLSHFEALKARVEAGQVPALADSGQDMLAAARQLLSHIEHLKNLRELVTQAERSWTESLRHRLRRDVDDRLIKILEALGSELEQAVESRNTFLSRPVAIAAGAELDPLVIEAVSNLAEGRSAFGIKGLFGRSEQRRLLDCIRIVHSSPQGAEAWQHVARYLALLIRLRELAVRWNAIAQELSIEGVPGVEPEHGLAAAQEFALYREVVALVRAEATLCEQSAQVFPSWPYSREVANDDARLAELERALQHHLTKSRLANVWAVKQRFQKVLEGKSGRVVDDIRQFLAQAVGNPNVHDTEMQARWATLMAELSRVLGVGSRLAIVRGVCDQIEASGAPRYAEALRKSLENAKDGLLPDTWRRAWRLRRLATYLDGVDAHDELKQLAKARLDVEYDLARAYSDVVVKRTWLKLAENASPSIRAALQAYLNAIQKIGKGTGKRAVRYRQDARQAAAQANPAVPCWIMPHHRVSESLPAELGCFDLVIIDEASQSDLSALPALLRATKVLIVGDDKQVSPEGVGLEEEKVRSLMNRFLGNQVLEALTKRRRFAGRLSTLCRLNCVG
jgi:hypothetical protein